MPSVLITGTSTGIGQAAAVELAKRGWRVFATMRNPGKAGPLKSALTAANVLDKVEIVQLDVNDAASIKDAVASVLERTGGQIDALVHNAGVAVGGAFEDMPDETLRWVMDTNFFGILSLTRAFLPTFRAQRRGRIVIVSSDAAFFGEPANAIYTASKWAIEGWAEAFMFEVELFGIEMALVEPGPYRTAIWESSPRILPTDGAYTPWVKSVFDSADKHAEKTARDPDEVGRAIGRLLEARKMRFRNPVGSLARLNHAFHGKVPSSGLRAMVRSYLGIKRRLPT